MGKLKEIEQKLIDVTIERNSLFKKYNELVRKAIVDSAYYKKDELEKFDKCSKMLENSQNSLLILQIVWSLNHPTTIEEIENINFEEYKLTYKLNDLELNILKGACDKVKELLEDEEFTQFDDNFAEKCGESLYSIILEYRNKNFAEIGLSEDEYDDMRFEAEDYYENISGIDLSESFDEQEDKYESKFNSLLSKFLEEANKQINLLN